MSLKPNLFVFDVDGVLTDGSFFYSTQGKVYKRFGPHDHDGIKLVKPLMRLLFVTADEKGFEITRKRVEEDLGQELLLLKEKERFNYLDAHFGISQLVYMGDGFYDAKILRRCLYGIAPQNARLEAKKAAHFITPSNGGNGAVLDASLKILEVFFPEELRKLDALI